ncbi:hypothetical protein [Nocardia fluminea]|uniref:hypothetical protein n=1 Tax=Nocardia fluminea TaxID=134984 RepID=UPI00342C093D
MTEHDIHSRWSPWLGQVPSPHGSRVAEQIPIAVRLAMLQADYDSSREILDLNVRDLAAVVGVHPMQMSYVELIASVRRISEDQRNWILELEADRPGCH